MPLQGRPVSAARFLVSPLYVTVLPWSRSCGTPGLPTGKRTPPPPIPSPGNVAQGEAPSHHLNSCPLSCMRATPAFTHRLQPVTIAVPFNAHAALDWPGEACSRWLLWWLHAPRPLSTYLCGTAVSRRLACPLFPALGSASSPRSSAPFVESSMLNLKSGARPARRPLVDSL